MLVHAEPALYLERGGKGMQILLPEHAGAALDALDTDALSPRDALDALYRLKRLAAEAEG